MTILLNELELQTFIKDREMGSLFLVPKNQNNQEFSIENTEIEVTFSGKVKKLIEKVFTDSFYAPESYHINGVFTGLAGIYLIESNIFNPLSNKNESGLVLICKRIGTRLRYDIQEGTIEHDLNDNVVEFHVFNFYSKRSFFPVDFDLLIDEIPVFSNTPMQNFVKCYGESFLKVLNCAKMKVSIDE